MNILRNDRLFFADKFIGGTLEMIALDRAIASGSLAPRMKKLYRKCWVNNSYRVFIQGVNLELAVPACHR